MEQVPHVNGQDSETPVRAQRAFVFLRATQSQLREILSPLAFENLILNNVSTQLLDEVEDVGLEVGDAVGVPV